MDECDLTISLTSPQSTKVAMLSPTGGNTDMNGVIEFDDEHSGDPRLIGDGLGDDDVISEAFVKSIGYAYNSNSLTDPIGEPQTGNWTLSVLLMI